MTARERLAAGRFRVRWLTYVAIALVPAIAISYVDWWGVKELWRACPAGRRRCSS